VEVKIFQFFQFKKQLLLPHILPFEEEKKIKPEFTIENQDEIKVEEEIFFLSRGAA